MNWYVAKIIFRIISGDGNHTAQFDEQLRLISAESEHSALEKANRMGQAEQSDFLNEKKETVKWEFVAVTEVNPVASLADGAEIYYEIHETPDAELFTELARRRSDLLAGRGEISV